MVEAESNIPSNIPPTPPRPLTPPSLPSPPSPPSPPPPPPFPRPPHPPCHPPFPPHPPSADWMDKGSRFTNFGFRISISQISQSLMFNVKCLIFIRSFMKNIL